MTLGLLQQYKSRVTPRLQVNRIALLRGVRPELQTLSKGSISWTPIDQIHFLQHLVLRKVRSFARCAFRTLPSELRADANYIVEGVDTAVNRAETLVSSRDGLRPLRRNSGSRIRLNSAITNRWRRQ